MMIKLLFDIYTVSGQQQGDLRFSGSFADGISGRLEVFINNEWGTICAEGFDQTSADAACRQLGNSRALSFGEAERLGYVCWDKLWPMYVWMVWLVQ